MNYQLIALDLDGTLLNSRKELSPGNRAALEAAANLGIQIVPATGRNFEGMPDFIRNLACARYYISCDGALVYDKETGSDLCSTGIPADYARDVLAFLEGCDGIADFYADGLCYMTASNLLRLEANGISAMQAAYIRSCRHPVASLSDTIGQVQSVHLMQIFLHHPEEKAALMAQLEARFPMLCVATSIPNNIEMNWHTATKGSALEALCRQLDIPISAAIAFGDQLNDIPMLQAAGTGIAMGNAAPEVRAAADRSTLTNDEDGVAAALAALL